MCRGCELDTGPSWGPVWAALSAEEKARQKSAQTSTLASILSAYAVTCRELPAFDSYQISNATGGHRIVLGMRHISAAINQLTGREVDVLDEALFDDGRRQN